MRGFLVLTVLLAACGTDKFSGDDAAGASEGGSDAGDATADGGFDVRGSGALVLWLDANRGVVEANGRVATWADQSGNMNDAHAAPMVASPKLDGNGANGRACLHFDAISADPAKGTLLAVDDKPSFQIGVQPFHITVVARWTNDPMMPSAALARGALAFKRTANGNGLILLANNPVPQPPTGGVAALVGSSLLGSNATMLNDNKFRSVTLIRTNNTVQLLVNGAPEGSIGGTMDVGGMGAPLLIGASGDVAGQDRLNGDIAEILVFVNKLPPPQLIETYVKTKYAL